MNLAIPFALVIVLIGATRATAQDALGPVRDLYASAEYEEALSELGRLKNDADTGGLVEIDRYRVLCLIALGRTKEADQVIETIVMDDPLYQPGAADAAPRVRAAFTAVRRRVLPDVARSLYADAKGAFDRKAFPEALAGLEKTVRVIDNLDGADNANLSDLRLLASGFLDLSRASVPPVPSPGDPPAGTEVPKEALPAPVAPPPAISVVAIRQEAPPLPSTLGKDFGEFRGVIEVEINESGDVVGAQIVQSIHRLYDPLLLRAARDWKYQPARVGSKRIPMRKRIEIVLQP